MEKTLQHEETTQCTGLPPAGSGGHRPDGPETGHALTLQLDHLNRADQSGLPQKKWSTFIVRKGRIRDGE